MNDGPGSGRWFGSRPTGLLLFLYRLPVYLYRLDLGGLLGHRALLLTHIGRKSGLPHQTVLEVILYDSASRESIVVSGYGERADWYRNLRANPALEVRTGRERYVPVHRFLQPEENLAMLSEYERVHPTAARGMSRIFGYPIHGSEAERRDFAQSVRLVAFRPVLPT